MDKTRGNHTDPLSDTKSLSTTVAKTRGKDHEKYSSLKEKALSTPRIVEKAQYNESVNGDTNLLSLAKKKKRSSVNAKDDRKKLYKTKTNNRTTRNNNDNRKPAYKPRVDNETI